MANTIGLVTKFQPILDEIYKEASVTARMDALTKPVNFSNAHVVEVFTTTPIGLGTYVKDTGYPAGNVTGAWYTLTLATDRGRQWSIDRMDDEESFGMAFGTLAGEIMRTKVVPEIDAYRFAKYSTWSGADTTTGATLTSSTVLAAIDAAGASMDANEVPAEGRLLYVSPTVNRMISAAVTRMLGNDNSVDRRVGSLDGMPIIPVPQTRFYKTCTLGDPTSGGYTNAGAVLNFMIIHPSAVLQVLKHEQLKIFTPDENQSMDSYLVQYRVYHDAFVYTQKVKGVYFHTTT
jgi:hypothetical protein